MSHKVYITNNQKAVKIPSGLRILIRRACNAALEYEKFEGNTEVSVIFVDNQEIAKLNEQYPQQAHPHRCIELSAGRK